MPELKGMLVGLLVALILLAFAGANWGLGKGNFFSIDASEKFSEISETIFLITGLFLMLLLGIDIFSEIIEELRKLQKILPALTILVSAILLTALVWFLLSGGSGRKQESAPDSPSCPGCNLIIIAIDGLAIEEVSQYGFPSETGKINALDSLKENLIVFDGIYSPIYDRIFSEEGTLASGKLLDPKKGIFIFNSQGRVVGPTNYSFREPLTISKTAESGYASRYFSDHPQRSLEGDYGIPLRFEGAEEIGLEGDALSNLALSIEKLPRGEKFTYFVRSSASSIAWQDYANRKYPFGPEAIRINTESGKIYQEVPLEDNFYLYELKGEASNVDALFSERRAGVRMLDSSLANVISALKKRDLLENTVVAITSTYPLPFVRKPLYVWNRQSGEELPLPVYSPFSWGTSFARASNIPLIIYVPGTPGMRTPALGTSADIVPTALSIIGIEGAVPSGATRQPLTEQSGKQEPIAIPLICNYTIDETAGFMEYFWGTFQVSEEGFAASNYCCVECEITTVKTDRAKRRETAYYPPRTDLFNMSEFPSGKAAFSIPRKA